MLKDVVKILFCVLLIFHFTGCFFKNESSNYAFDDMSLGIYTWEDSKGENSMTFELGQSGGKYYYVLEFYYDGASVPSEELWGIWNVTQSEFIPSNDNTNSYAQYQFKNVKYQEQSISFEIEVHEVINSKDQKKTIPSGKYQLIKYES